MNRQKGVWITIICILVIGVSVTKMTSRFVSTSALATVEAEEDAFLPRNAGGSETAQRAAAAEETMAAEAADGFAAPAERSMGAAPRAAMADVGAADSAAPAAEDAPLQAAPAAGQAVEETAPAALQETVKSPLDPTGIVPGQNYIVVERANENSKVTFYTAEDYEERLDQTAAQIVQYREASVGSKGGTAHIAAEYELGVWDNELNTLYTLIRSRMDDAEREDLKQEELDWMKERDAAADRAAARASGQTSQSTAYTEAAASKTKERCYELVEDYGDVIDRGFEKIEE